mmetsp:Transcript_19741/g.47876  ORF Transcript_19741/g.47876 Transcript_19741/m.47876 type:complete len:90 (+) Transcript_19741:538-807(+)
MAAWMGGWMCLSVRVRCVCVCVVCVAGGRYGHKYLPMIDVIMSYVSTCVVWCVINRSIVPASQPAHHTHSPAQRNTTTPQHHSSKTKNR